MARGTWHVGRRSSATAGGRSQGFHGAGDFAYRSGHAASLSSDRGRGDRVRAAASVLTARQKPHQASSPGPRWGHAIAYDEARDRLILFGGQRDRKTALADTWLWDGRGWTQAPVPGPAARSYAAMAYDPRRARVVLHGGREHLEEAGGDTWEWDGRQWTRASDAGPAPRDHHALAWDGAGGEVMLFGGFSGSAVTADTWSWNGERWRLLADTGPPPRAAHGLAYEARRGRVLLFGGLYLGGLYGDTWEWRDNTWTRHGPVFAATLDHHAMAFDGARGELIAFGGKDYRFTFQNRTLRFVDGAWGEVSAEGPKARINPALAFHHGRQRIVMYGGRGPGDEPYGDLWLWDGTRWHQAP